MLEISTQGLNSVINSCVTLSKSAGYLGLSFLICKMSDEKRPSTAQISYTVLWYYVS